MNTLTIRRYALCSCVAAAMLAGCGGHASNGVLPAIAAPNTFPYHKTFKYTGGAQNFKVPAGVTQLNVVAHGAFGAQGTGGSVALGARVHAVLPVTPGHELVVFVGGNTKGSAPRHCAINSKGNLWVTNIGHPNVTEYLQGSTKPNTVITKGLTYPVALAIDHSGNMYVANGAYNGEGPYSVVVYAPGGKSPSRTITDGVTAPNGIAVDAEGTLYVANRIANDVEKCRSGQNHPYQTITDGVINPAGITVNKQGWLYVVVYGNTEKDVVVVEYPPGSTTPSDRQISKGILDPFGTAYSPPLLP